MIDLSLTAAYPAASCGTPLQIVPAAPRNEQRLCDQRVQESRTHAADREGRRRGHSIGLSIAVVGGTFHECMTLPDAILRDRAREGARQAAAACDRLRLRATFLVPGAHALLHIALLRELAPRHEIGLYGFDPVRPAPDDPFRARERVVVALGGDVCWYCPAFCAPTSEEAVLHAGLRRVPRASPVRLAGLKFRLAPILQFVPIARLTRSVAAAALARARSQVAFQSRDMHTAAAEAVLHVHLNAANLNSRAIDAVATAART